MVKASGSLIQIVPSLSPVIDGIGDYALQLARKLRSVCGIETSFLVCDPAWPRGRWTGEFRAVGAGGRSAGLLVEAANLLLSEHNEGERRALLHFSPYGYQKRGCPLWIARGLTALRNTASVELSTAFHELDVEGASPWSSAYWVPPVQRSIIRRLLQLSSFAYTNTGVHRSKLEHWVHGDVLLVPNFSNLGEIEGAFPAEERAREIVIFGRADQRRWTYQRGDRALARLCEYLQPTRIVDVGAPIVEHTALTLHGVPIERCGVLPAAEVASVMRSAAATLMHYPVPLLTKSGVHALACASGTVSFIAGSGSGGTTCEGLDAGVDYLPVDDASQLPSWDDIGALHRKIYRNYQRRNSASAAVAIAGHIFPELHLGATYDIAEYSKRSLSHDVVPFRQTSVTEIAS